MIDLHTHVLPGIDDGPASVDGSVRLASAAAEDGATVVVATPHIDWERGNDASIVAAGVAELQRTLDAAGVAIRLRTGGEVVITRAIDLPDEELAALRLGGGEWLLAECPLSTSAAGFELLLHQLQGRGHRIVLAHPERSPELQRRPDLVRDLVAAGMLCSITAGSLRGDFGSTVRRFSLELLEADLVHNVASDAHDTQRRRPGITDGIAAAAEELDGVEERADWYTRAVPAAILDGAPIPPAPGPPPARRRRRGLFRRAGRPR